jgi:glutamyl-tRNA reductase
VAVGLSHKTAPVELRERLAIPEAQMGEALTQLQSRKGLKEAVILSTCNRLEVYARPESDRKETIHSIQEFIQQLYKQSALLSSIYHFEALDAVQHLFRVSAGLDSLVVGEGEVLGQVKSAYQFAQKHGSTGKITNVLFQRALYVGKQVRSNTNIARGSSSVGSMAVHLAERIFGSLQNHNILI